MSNNTNPWNGHCCPSCLRQKIQSLCSKWEAEFDTPQSDIRYEISRIDLMIEKLTGASILDFLTYEVHDRLPPHKNLLLLLGPNGKTIFKMLKARGVV